MGEQVEIDNKYERWPLGDHLPEITLLLLVLLFYCIFAYPALLSILQPGLSPETQTTDIISSFSEEIFYASITTQKQHPLTVKDVLEMNDERLSYHSYYDDIVKNEFIKDGWGNRIIIEFTEPSTYKFISYGPNEKDDNCEGDDIYAVFDLSLENYGVKEQKGLWEEE